MVFWREDKKGGKMRKLNARCYYILIIIFSLIGGIFLYQIEKQPREPDQDILILNSNQGVFTDVNLEEIILVEILSVNYLENKEYLIRVKVGGEQVGVVYFDENGEIRFDGDREKFEDTIYRAIKLREEYWGYENEKK